MTPLMGERVPVIERDYMTVSTEIDHEGYTFIHCDVYKWSSSIYKEMLEDWVDWLANNTFRDNVVLVALQKEDTKIIKFIEMFGFEYLQTHQDYVVYIMGVE